MKKYINYITENINIDSYDFQKIDNNRYFFISTGEKFFGKMVTFTKVASLFSLDFGDLSYDKNNKIRVSYSNISNNGDISKVLKTIYDIILDFISDKECNISFIGSDEQRKNVYNYLIRKYYDDISEIFIIFGYIKNNDIKQIEKNDKLTYDSIILIKK